MGPRGGVARRLARSDGLLYAADQVIGGGFAGHPGIDGRPLRPVLFLLGTLGTLVYVAFGLALFRTRGNERLINGQDEVDLRCCCTSRATVTPWATSPPVATSP